MTRQEIQSQISEIENYLYQNDYSMSQKDIKAEKRKIRKLKKSLLAIIAPLEAGCEISLEDFIIHLNSSVKNETAMTRWMIIDKRRHTEEEFDVLKEMVGHNYGVYNFFLKSTTPTDISRVVLHEEKEEVKSNNIYDLMCAPQRTTFRSSFKLKMFYNQEPVTVFREFTKDTTLSMREVRSFM